MKRKRKVEQYGSDWEDIFYITNLNDGTYSYRREDPRPWYNVRFRPNAINNSCRHFCIACGSDYDKMLKAISRCVSRYGTPDEMFFFMTSNCQDGARQGKRMLEIQDEYWEELWDSEYIEQYYPDINSAIRTGKKTRIYAGTNVTVTVNEEEEYFFVDGRWAAWFEEFVANCMNFDGYTKQEFYESIKDDCDIYCVNQIFGKLKKMGVKGIKQMKKLDMYKWTHVLAPLVNDWDFGDVSDSDWYNISSDDEE